MRFVEFEKVMSSERMSRYVNACNGNLRKAVTLYRYNLQLTQKLFTIISCFEIALRNQIDVHYLSVHGNHWLRNAAQTGGFFDTSDCKVTCEEVNRAIGKLRNSYTHAKLIAELGFGFWRYMFAPHQYRVAGQNLINIFPNRPSSSAQKQYNNKLIFNLLKEINNLRNRLAHHEPVSFCPRMPVIDTMYAKNHYQNIAELFQWMGIDHNQLLYGLDHVDEVFNKIDTHIR